MQPAIPGKLDAWKHQLGAYYFSFLKSGVLLDLGMGCGKTKVTLDLLANWGSIRTLLLTPLAVVPVWLKEAGRHLAVEHTLALLDQSSGQKKAAEAARLLAVTPADHPLILVCNYEAAWREELGKILLKHHWDVVALDESHRIKDPQGRASKFCAQLTMRSRRRLCLTGTPMPHSPLDIFAQYRFLEPSIFGTSYTEFRARYTVCDKMFPSKVNKWINQEDLQEKIGLIAYRVKSEDVLDLPPISHIYVPVMLSSAARRVYDQLEKEFVAELGAAGGRVSAENALVKLLRLQQIACGFVMAYGENADDPTSYRQLDDKKARTLQELIGDLGGEKCVVFCKFKPDLAAVAAVSVQTQRRYGEVSGERKDLDDATYPDRLDVLGVQVQAGDVGIDLSKAAHAFFYSTGFLSPGQFDQCVARVHRPGQTRHTRCYHLIATGTVDEAVYQAIQEKRDIIEYVLETLKLKGDWSWTFERPTA